LVLSLVVLGAASTLQDYLVNADYESGRNERNTLTVSPENIGRSGLGKKFWNIKVKKCRAKAAANKHECRSGNPRRGPQFASLRARMPSCLSRVSSRARGWLRQRATDVAVGSKLELAN